MPPQGHTDVHDPRNALGWAQAHPDMHSRGCRRGFRAPSHRHTHIPSIRDPSRNYTRPQHQNVKFISPSLSKESRRPNLKQDLRVGWNTNLTFPGMGRKPGTPSSSGRESLCPRPVGRSRGSTRKGEDPPRTGLGPACQPADPHPHPRLPAQACNLQTSSDRPPEAATTRLPSAQIWAET